MSGPTCPKCGCPYLRSVNDPSLGKMPVQCEYCQWKGDVSDRPRKMLHPEMYNRWAEKMEKLRSAKLFIIQIRADESVNEHVIPDIMEALGINSASHRTENNVVRMDVEQENKPSEDVLKKLREIPGVIEVSVRP